MFRGLLVGFAVSLVPLATATAQEVVRYRLEINSTWSKETHPLDFFPDAHLTRFIGVAHNSRYVLFDDGRIASSGLQSLAERGRIDILRVELDDARERKRAGEVFEGEGFGTPGSATVTFEATKEYGLVSFATMIAPSPDWFTGAASVPLFDGSNWVDRIEVPLWPWDAGTDSGESWTAENTETQPRESIRLSAVPYFLGPDGLKPLGTATFERLRE